MEFVYPGFETNHSEEVMSFDPKWLSYFFQSWCIPKWSVHRIPYRNTDSPTIFPHLTTATIRLRLISGIPMITSTRMPQLGTSTPNKQDTQ